MRGKKLISFININEKNPNINLKILHHDQAGFIPGTEKNGCINYSYKCGYI